MASAASGKRQAAPTGHVQHAGFGRDDTGIHTVEGNLAGERAARLSKKRAEDQAEYEAKKRKIEEDAALGVRKIDDKFNKHTTESAREQAFRQATTGLVTAADFKRAREVADGEPAAAEGAGAEAAVKKQAKAEKKAKQLAKKKAASTLSFGDDLDDEDAAAAAEGAGVAAKGVKNPHVDTSFLPDRKREQEQERERERLKAEWCAQQERIKAESLTITYSYWDGSGHRREITLPKGTTVGKFLGMVQQQLSAEFGELRATSSDNLIYVKEDLLIPHHFSFYDLIVTKARGKSGPLFHFDVHDDVRLTDDVRVEKDESHPGKVIQRAWYERNKHIFPASRWEVYDPAAKRDRYTIHGDEVNAKES